MATGSAFQTCEMVSGQKLSRLKKFMPATKATAKASPTTRWFLNNSKGTMGWRANFHSHTNQTTRRPMPMKRVQRVYAEVHGCV